MNISSASFNTTIQLTGDVYDSREEFNTSIQFTNYLLIDDDGNRLLLNDNGDKLLIED